MTFDTYRLSDNTNMSVAPNWGANLFSWVVDGVEMMYRPDDYPAAAWKITGGGNPLLFPSVGRTYDTTGPEPVLGRYQIYGHDRKYEMITHGVLFHCAWTSNVESSGPDWVRVEYRAGIPDTVRSDNYPFDVSFSQTYTLRAKSVELEATLVNNGREPAPAAFGYHPYFRVSNPRREGMSVDLPVTRRMFLDDNTQLTGKSEPADGKIILEPDVYYDHPFAGINGRRMTLTDSLAGHRVHVDFDETFELLFLYSPDSADFVCIEPWTRGLGGYSALREPGWEDGAAIPVLAPGETRSHKAVFSAER
jgi:aldose 1-epimerase